MKVIYHGQNEALNYEVAEATDGNARMKTGRAYNVPAELGKRLTATADWSTKDKAGKEPADKKAGDVPAGDVPAASGEEGGAVNE